jgi:hypothetical protein
MSEILRLPFQRQDWPIFATIFLLALCLLLLWLMPNEFSGPLAGIIILLLLLPLLWGFGLLASRIADMFRRRRALNPNLSPEEMKKLAESFPEVLQNAVVPLLSLENPNFFAELQAIVDAHPTPQRDAELEFRRSLNDGLKQMLAFPVIMLIMLLLLWFFRSPAKPNQTNTEIVAPAGLCLYNGHIFIRQSGDDDEQCSTLRLSDTRWLR